MNANEDMRAYWNGEVGKHWVDLDAALEQAHGAFNAPLIAAAGIGPGDRVLDLGCGTGSLTHAVSNVVGPEGSVTGVDISEVMLAAAQSVAPPKGGGAIDYLGSDAQEHRFEPESFDRIVSRLGFMFFDNPPAAFGNLREAVRQGGTFHGVAWRNSAEDNPWFVRPKQIAETVLPMPPDPGDPRAPGPLALADTDYGLSLLAQGGWERVEVAPLRATLSPRGGMAGALSLLTQIGPGARVIRSGQASPIEIATYRNRIAAWLSEVMDERDLHLPVVMNLYSAVRRD